ncbi:endoribonuclease YSH1 [Kwoniella dejecticola CBS 10117]|uniref:Endoribonuclease YSH1 n=1 Tax=Kwoniella dejecticola CBS 10117 TaxID=1296121 RepID=A0A1A6A9H9_9TREE|nr:endoribonuclease YSH1 [Kwoniella dejecticola CBS 10117]OBR86711.1 endoribonuclease YSH1 [Kwoniella dejecticola CBS 10117]
MHRHPRRHYRPQHAVQPPIQVLSPAGDDEPLTITMLGAGQEVGRSCCVIEHRGKKVVCDAGLHPAHPGLGSLPFIDEVDWSTVDAILVTHFHVDHAAALPYIMEKTNFKDGNGKVYMTHATKAIYGLTMMDTVRINDQNPDVSGKLYDEADVQSSWQSTIAVDYHQDIVISGGLRFTPYHAGHVLGASMFMIEIAGLKILYTGDYSREEDRHLVVAEIPPVKPDVMICESTFGVHTLPDRKEKEEQFTTLVANIVRRGGRCLMPIPSFGNGQELALLLDEYWSEHPELQNTPVYFASGLFQRGMRVYKTYVHTMNQNIRSRFARRDNPFDFKYVKWLKDPRKLNEHKGPCVVMASAQFMSFGLSRELLEDWAADSKNGVIVTGYSIEGTMARTLLSEPDHIELLKGGNIPRRLTVKEISFGAHVDYAQNSKFIQEIGAQHIVLVHGEASQMGRLRAALRDTYATRGQEINIHTPRNCEPLVLTFRQERVVKAIGSLAADRPVHGTPLKGLLVSKDFSYTLLDPKDLKDFTGLSTSSLVQKQAIPIGVDWSVIRWHLEGMYGEVEESADEEGRACFTVMNAVKVVQLSEMVVEMQWSSDTSNDMIADSALAVLLGIDGSPATVKLTSTPHQHSHHHHDHAHDHPHPNGQINGNGNSNGLERANEEFDRIKMFLESHFGNVTGPNVSVAEGEEDELLSMTINVDEVIAKLDLISMRVESDSSDLKRRVETVLEMALTTLQPLSRSFIGSGVNLNLEDTAIPA